MDTSAAVPHDIQIVGHVCVDLTPAMRGRMNTEPGTLTEVGAMGIRIGGAVGNGLRAATALRRRVAVAATVGSDELGALCRAGLEARIGGSDILLSESSRSATSYSVVLERANVDRTFWHHTGANDDFDGSCDLVGARFLHYGYPMLTPAMTRESGRPTVELFARARQQGSATSLDLAYSAENSSLRGYDWDEYFRRVLPWTDVFCPSWDDITSAHGHPDVFNPGQVERAANDFLDRGAGVVLITAGASGSYVATGQPKKLARLALASGIDPEACSNTRAWIPAAPVERFVSSNGAGDTFKVAFLLSLLTEPDVVDAAGRAAAIVARHISDLPLSDGQR